MNKLQLACAFYMTFCIPFTVLMLLRLAISDSRDK